MGKKERLEECLRLWRDYTPEGSDELILINEPFMDFLINDGFFDAPASTKYHGAYEGGLYDHSKQVFLRLAELTENNHLKWQRKESPFIVGMFHDLCKYDQYKKVPGFVADSGDRTLTSQNGWHYEYNSQTLLKGHGPKSIMVLSRFITLTEEEMLCIRYHMGAYETDEWDEWDRALKKYENVLWTHHADQLASKIDNV